jgi:hypothetical protein
MGVGDVAGEAFVPIGAPRFARAPDVALVDAEPLLVVRGDEVRAWPLLWLLERELALDEVDGVPVAVTFCSLCSVARVLDLRLDDEVLDLAVSGLVVDGNALLFDRRTESLGRQFDGVALAGAHAGRQLAEVPSFVLSLGALRRARPDARVMLAPEPARTPPLARLTADHVARGEPPAWLSPSCPRPLAMSFATAELESPLETAGPRVENLPGLVVFRDPDCAAVHRSPDGRPGAVTGSAAAFRREVRGRTLSFEARGADLVDRETGSRWSLLGEAREGPLAGARLEVVPGVQGFRFALLP